VNLSDLLVDHPFGDDDGLLFTAKATMTAGQARAAARRTADAIRGLGVSPGQAVAVQLPNGPDAITTMIGVWLAGCVFVPLNPRAPDLEVQAQLSALEPAARITTAGARFLGGTRGYPPGTAFVLWTSGTTGAPKPILHTHDAYFEILDRVLGQLRRKPSGPGASRNGPGPAPSPNLIPVSLALNSGIYNSLFGLRAGAGLVLMDRFEPRGFAELVGRFAIRSTVLPPAAIAMLNRDESITDLAPLRYVRSITAPLSADEARRFSARFGVFVLNGYGQAEIGEVIGWTAQDARDHPDKLGAVGRAHPGVEVRIDGDAHLWVRPPRRAAGYAAGGDLEERIDADGFVDTGDLARMDEDGFIWIEGRAGDVIIRGGHKVQPSEVEQVLCRAPGVADAAVVGRPDDRLGQVPVAFYEGQEHPDGFLADFCREHLVPYKIPVSFHWTAALPRNEAGKVLRTQLV
jgi:acyl-CoA synthetase (AMP-forming)/AMP-acid ligase II